MNTCRPSLPSHQVTFSLPGRSIGLAALWSLPRHCALLRTNCTSWSTSRTQLRHARGVAEVISAADSVGVQSNRTRTNDKRHTTQPRALAIPKIEHGGPRNARSAPPHRARDDAHHPNYRRESARGGCGRACYMSSACNGHKNCVSFRCIERVAQRVSRNVWGCACSSATRLQDTYFQAESSRRPFQHFRHVAIPLRRRH